MKVGISMFPADHAMAPDAIAREVEERGFDALSFPEHTHIPTSRRTPFPGGTPLPAYYARTHDPFVALTAAAMVTERIELWTGIALIAQRDPIVTAKAVASVDVLSKGRLHLGIGYGWNREELEDHGVAYADRRAVVRERILAMKELWTAEEASFAGEHVAFEPTWSWPKPMQAGGPKIHLGSGAGPKSFADVAEFCDGWMPISLQGGFAASLPTLAAALEARGRSLADLELTMLGPKPDKDAIARLAELGVARIIFPVPCESPEAAVRALDAYMPFVAP